MNTISNMTGAGAAFDQLEQFIGAAQAECMADMCRTEEKQFMYNKLAELVNTISTMPKTYETDGQGKAAMAHLHYFIGGCDWYITERDMEHEQIQAFGLADLGHGGELGYISLQEITSAGAELDLYWTLKPLSECE